MPELPDLDILADGLGASLLGRSVISTTVTQSLVVRGTSVELAALVGQPLRSLTRRGKFLTFQLDPDRVVINPMLTGRLGFAAPGAKPFPQTAFTITFGPRTGRPPVPAWARRASWIPPDELPLELRYRDPTRMGKVYLMPAGVTRPMAGWDEQGPDADDPAFDEPSWSARIAKHTGEIKGLLKNQAFVAGIGNGYSDEILWEARLAPFRKRSSLAPEEVGRLYTATREVLPWAIGELRKLVPPKFEVEQRAFLRVHRKGGQPCARCGTTLSEVSPGGFVTTWCRTCQQ